MHKILAITLVVLAGLASGADRIQDIVANEPFSEQTLARLTTNDVPDQWRTRVEVINHDKGTIKVFYRGQDKIMQVTCLKQPVGVTSNAFSASVFDGQKSLGSITSYNANGFTIQQSNNSKTSHMMITIVKDDGKIRVFFKNDTDYFQYIEVDGPNTHLLDDLDYTRERIRWEKFSKPLAEEIINGLKPFKEQADKLKQNQPSP